MKIAIIIVLVLTSCHWWNRVDPPIPARPVPECGPTGYMIRAGTINSALQDCYACEKASRCVDAGNHYCCEEQMCSECQPSPAFFGGAP